MKRVVSYLVSALRAFGPIGFNCVPENLIPSRSNMPCCVPLAAAKTTHRIRRNGFQCMRDLILHQDNGSVDRVTCLSNDVWPP